LSADSVTTGSPVFSHPRSMPPPKPWRGWKPFPGIGFVSSRSFRPMWYPPPALPLRSFGLTVGSPAIEVPTLGITAMIVNLADYRWPWDGSD
jgi:hypothetical protein